MVEQQYTTRFATTTNLITEIQYNKNFEPEPEPRPESELQTQGYNKYIPHNQTVLPNPIPEYGNVTGEPWAEPEPPTESSKYMPPLAVIAGILGLIIVIENCMILFAMIKGRPKHPPQLNYLIINLSIADMTAGAQLIWFTCFDYYLSFPRSPTYILVLCGLWLMTISASVLGLISFAWHRLGMVRGNSKMEHAKGKTRLFIVCAWLSSALLLVIPPVAGWNCSYCMGNEYCSSHCSFVLYPFTKAYVLMLSLLLYIALITLYIMYTWIFVAVGKKMKRVHKTNMLKREKVVVQTVFILLTVFTICMLPVAVLLTIDYIRVDYNPPLIICFQIATVFSFLSSACNPLLYMWRLPTVRDATWRALGRPDRVTEYSNAVKNGILSREETRNKGKLTVSGKNMSVTETPNEGI